MHLRSTSKMLWKACRAVEEWAVSDAAHGGADDEDAPPEPASKRRKGASGAATRVRRARADRTGLYQLALLLRSCSAVGLRGS